MDSYVSEGTAWLRKTIRRTISMVLILVSAWFLIYGSCTQVPVSGGSVRLVSSADDVTLVNRLVYDVGEPGQLDIVVFERKNHKKNVKQVIGLPGRAVQIKGGYISIDGELLNAEDDSGQMSLAGRTGTSIKLEGNEYFLLGDNRGNNEGGRFLSIGDIKREQIRGKIRFKIFPLLKLSFIHPG